MKPGGIADVACEQAPKVWRGAKGAGSRASRARSGDEEKRDGVSLPFFLAPRPSSIFSLRPITHLGASHRLSGRNVAIHTYVIHDN